VSRAAAGTAGLDPFDVRHAIVSHEVAEFNAAGVLVAADVHVARTLTRLGGDEDPLVVLAAALAARAPRLGHTYVDLAAVRHTVAVDADVPVDVSALPWPEPGEWIARLAASPLVGGGEAAPLRLEGTRLYLDRYWREERRVAADLEERAADEAPDVDLPLLDAGLDRLFGSQAADQRLAAATAVRRRLTVVAGGPGTGKTTTVAKILALISEQAAAAGRRPPLVALAAPTGKAASRLEEAVHDEAATLDVDESVRSHLLAAGASTLHRLLGWRPDSRSRFRHDRHRRLPHDVVVIDETSMVSLSLMAKLVEAVRPDARLIFVGDPQQLASVEAGAVLGDVVGPADDGPVEGVPLGRGVVVLRTVYRHGGGIAELAEAIRHADVDATLAVLAAGGEDGDVVWIRPGDSGMAADQLTPIRDALVTSGRRIKEAAAAGDGATALEALAAFRLLCAHRRGPYGVEDWSAQAERWLAAALGREDRVSGWWVGRPVLVTENDYALRLSNGDTGVAVDAGGGRMAVVFERRGDLVQVAPTRLGAVETVHAMTVHKSQGSQFATVAVVLPEPDSPILTRELLYTAATRARTQLIVAGTEASIRTAVTRPVARASGLRHLLWGDRTDTEV
jgi:exodeoxyribonuclease V alpha subunit